MTQGVSIRLGDTAPDQGGLARVPDMLLAAEPGWLSPGAPFPARGLLLRLRAGQEDDATLAAAAETLAGCGQLDLEAVLPEGIEPGAALDTLALRLARAGLFPRHVAVLPEALPSGEDAGFSDLGPRACAAAVAAAFPEARVGLGMLSNFAEPELRSGATAEGDYVTHGASVVSQAAEDEDVLEALAALPQVFADARRAAEGRALRLGLVSVGVRSTVAGSGEGAALRRGASGPAPRQKDLMAAAYAIAACASAAQAGAEAVALAAPAGPFGLVGADGAARPILHAVAAIHGAEGRLVRIDPVPGLRGLAWEHGAILANAGLSPVTVSAPFPRGAVLSAATLEAARDPVWLSEAVLDLLDQVTLGPCDCLFAGEAAPPRG